MAALSHRVAVTLMFTVIGCAMTAPGPALASSVVEDNLTEITRHVYRGSPHRNEIVCAGLCAHLWSGEQGHQGEEVHRDLYSLRSRVDISGFFDTGCFCSPGGVMKVKYGQSVTGHAPMYGEYHLEEEIAAGYQFFKKGSSEDPSHGLDDATPLPGDGWLVVGTIISADCRDESNPPVPSAFSLYYVGKAECDHEDEEQPPFETPVFAVFKAGGARDELPSFIHPKPVRDWANQTQGYNFASPGANPGFPGFAVVKQRVREQLASGRYPDLVAFYEAKIAAWNPPPAEPAIHFRPRLLFDSSERFRPLDVDKFLSERKFAGGTLHNICDHARPVSTRCLPLYGAYVLSSNNTSTAYIDTPTATNAGSARSPDLTCLTPDRYDCDEGPRSAIYYHVVDDPVGSGYEYIDYWWFYRYNDWAETVGIFNHQGDWEGVTVAPSTMNPGTFDFASFSSHGTYYSYTRETLRCDAGAEGSCGSLSARTGTRLRVYVANGSHANYPAPCSAVGGLPTCMQPIDVPEKGHDGEHLWGNDDDPQAVMPLPAEGEGRFVDWAGSWGSADHGIYSPACQDPHFHSPWAGPATTYTCGGSGLSAFNQVKAESTQTTRVLEDDDEARAVCAPWFGPGVAVAACEPDALRAAVRSGSLGATGATRVSIRRRSERGGDRLGRGEGVAQALGRPLNRGDRVFVRGDGNDPVSLLVRVAKGDRMAVQRYELTAPPAGVRYTVRWNAAARRPALVQSEGPSEPPVESSMQTMK